MPYQDSKKCCICFSVSTESGIKGIFAVFILETIYVVGLTLSELAKAAPVVTLDLLLALPLVFMLLHLILAFKNESAV